MTTLRITEGPAKGKQIELEGDVVFVGRGAKNNIKVNDHTVSRMHLKIFCIGTAVFVEDLKSSNGTLINGAPLEPGEGRQVDAEDVITIGNTVIRLEDVISPKDPDYEERVLGPHPGAEGPSACPKDAERRSRSFRETEFISKLSELLRGPIKLGEALDRMVEQLLDMLPRIDRVAVFVRDKETGDVKRGALRTKPDREPVPFSLEAVQEAFDEGRAVTVADATGRGSKDSVDEGGTMEIKSLLCVPVTAQGRVFGVLYLDGIKGPYAYRQEDMLWIETAGTLIAYAIENAELSSRMSMIAGLSSPQKKH